MNNLKAEDIKLKIKGFDSGLDVFIDDMPNMKSKQVVIIASSFTKNKLEELFKISEGLSLYIHSNTEMTNYIELVIY